MEKAKKPIPIPTASARLDDGRVLELIFRPEEGKTLFIVSKDGKWEEKRIVTLRNGRTLVPYSATNNLLTHEVVVLPSGVGEYESEAGLLAAVREFIHRYVDLSDFFEEVASYYVLFSFVYDDFNELPYLRVRGDYGSGKTRFLQTVGSICYLPIFASGSASVSPLFRILDIFRGTLVIDEGDFRVSDERAQVVKILNNGNARGFPVLRSEQKDGKEFNPRAFHVFGPKVIATRNLFEDKALESRCLTEEMGGRKLRPDIPINLTEEFWQEARELRNKLLAYRLQNIGQGRDLTSALDRRLEPRLAQIFTPLLSTIEDPDARKRILDLGERYGHGLVADRSLEAEAMVLEVIAEIREVGQPLLLKEIARAFEDRFGFEFDHRVTSRWIGSILRQKLMVTPTKSDGNFLIPLGEYPKLDQLFERYGLRDFREESEGVADESQPS